MAAWAYQSSGSVASSGSGAALSPGAPASVAAGDLLLLFTGQRTAGAAGPGAISGWTLLHSYGYSGAGLDLWGRIATGTGDIPSVDWDGTNFCFAWIERYTGGGYTDLATIVAHAVSGSGTATAMQLPAYTPATVDNCLLVGFASKNNTAVDATTISHSVLTKRTQLVSTSAGRLHAASGSLQQTTAADYAGSDFSIDGTAESLSSRGMVVYLRTSSATRKLKVLVDADAQSDTAIAGVVFHTPSGGDITGDKIGEFTGAAFSGTLEGGKAVIKVPVADFGGEALTTSDVPVVLVRNGTDTTGLTVEDVSIIEE